MGKSLLKNVIIHIAEVTDMQIQIARYDDFIGKYEKLSFSKHTLIPFPHC